VTYWLCYCRL